MRATLYITSGKHSGRKIALRDGQIAQFGRTEWADFSFPGDPAMAEVHFSIDCTGRGCAVRDVPNSSGTLVNGQPVANSALGTGMVVTAGKTTFLVVLGDDVWPPPASALADTVRTAQAATPALPSAIRQLAAKAEISEPGLALVKDEQTPEDLIAQLRKHGLWDDALALLSVSLAKPAAVAWVCQCIRSLAAKSPQLLSDADQTALSLAERWAKEPSDEIGRQAEVAAAALRHQTPAAWAAMAAHYSGASLAPPEFDAVPPPEGLNATAVRTAIILVLARVDRAHALRVKDEFCQLGIDGLKNEE